MSESCRLRRSVLKVGVLKLTTSHSLSSLFSEDPGCTCWLYGSLKVNSGNFFSSGLRQAGVYVLKPEKGSFRSCVTEQLREEGPAFPGCHSGVSLTCSVLQVKNVLLGERACLAYTATEPFLGGLL